MTYFICLPLPDNIDSGSLAAITTMDSVRVYGQLQLRMESKSTPGGGKD